MFQNLRRVSLVRKHIRQEANSKSRTDSVQNRPEGLGRAEGNRSGRRVRKLGIFFSKNMKNCLAPCRMSCYSIQCMSGWRTTIGDEPARY